MKLQGLTKSDSNQHLSKGAGLAPTAIHGTSSFPSTWSLASPVDAQLAGWVMVMKPVVYKSHGGNGGPCPGFTLYFELGMP